MNEIIAKMLTEKYFTARELKYDTKTGIFLSPYQYKLLLEKFDFAAINNVAPLDKVVHGLKLKTFNNYNLRISFCDELFSKVNDFLDLVLEDVETNKSFLSFRNLDAITKSRIFSEIEGTLNIESVPTTRKLLQEIIVNKRKPANNNEQIILNMSKGIEFVNKCPDFNKENLFNLYSILSKGCLQDDQKLKPGTYYRYDDVTIDNYECCPPEKIESRMDSLFEFFEENRNSKEFKLFLPHIAHYYIVYIHPYFDFNGRTARMVSYWLFLLLDQVAFPPVVSDAINQTKNKYYSALRETRDSHNDLTYFLLYIYNISVDYFLTYKNIEHIDGILKNKAIVLSETDKTYIKKILISLNGKFTYEDFIKWSNSSMSKQGAFKILNQLETYEVLKSEFTNSNKKLFYVNRSLLKYGTKSE